MYFMSTLCMPILYITEGAHCVILMGTLCIFVLSLMWSTIVTYGDIVLLRYSHKRPKMNHMERAFVSWLGVDKFETGLRKIGTVRVEYSLISFRQAIM